MGFDPFSSVNDKPSNIVQTFIENFSGIKKQIPGIKMRQNQKNNQKKKIIHDEALPVIDRVI